MEFTKNLKIASITGHQRTINRIKNNFLYFSDGFIIHSNTMRRRLQKNYYIIITK